MNIVMGGDHAGFEYKKALVALLSDQGHLVKDVGPHSAESCDYPDFAHPVADEVVHNPNTFGVLICGSGNGVCITANKHAGVRAALCWDIELAQLARQHNNANIICIPARFVSLEKASEMVHTFLTTTFEGGRHQNRVNKIDIS